MDKEEIIEQVERELKETLVHYTIKATQEENIVSFRVYTEIGLDHSQITKIISLGRVTMKRSGKGITIRISRVIG